jgi:hypothetical protein
MVSTLMQYSEATTGTEHARANNVILQVSDLLRVDSTQQHQTNPFGHFVFCLSTANTAQLLFNAARNKCVVA